MVLWVLWVLWVFMGRESGAGGRPPFYSGRSRCASQFAIQIFFSSFVLDHKMCRKPNAEDRDGPARIPIHHEPTMNPTTVRVFLRRRVKSTGLIGTGMQFTKKRNLCVVSLRMAGGGWNPSARGSSSEHTVFYALPSFFSCTVFLRVFVCNCVQLCVFSRIGGGDGGKSGRERIRVKFPYMMIQFYAFVLCVCTFVFTWYSLIVSWVVYVLYECVTCMVVVWGWKSTF